MSAAALVSYIHPVTEGEARTLITTVRFHLFQANRHENAAREAALEFKRKEAWRVLGYKSLSACFEAELGTSWQQGYRLAAAAEVDEAIAEFSPIGETPTVPDTHARHLHTLPREKQYVAFDRARTMAQAEGAKQVTARHVEKAVAAVEAEISIQDNPVISRAVASGEISPDAGVKIKRELDTLPPQHQANVMEIMSQHGLSDSRLVVPLAEVLTRPPGKESKVGQEIKETGHVAGVPLAQASLSDLEKLRQEARKEHISEGLEQKRQNQVLAGLPVTELKVITVYTNEPGKTLDALVRALPLDDLKSVAELMMEYVIMQFEKEPY